MISDALTVARHVTPAITSASSSPPTVQAAQTALEGQRGMQRIYYAGAVILGLTVAVGVTKHFAPPQPKTSKKKKKT